MIKTEEETLQVIFRTHFLDSEAIENDENQDYLQETRVSTFKWDYRVQVDRSQLLPKKHRRWSTTYCEPYIYRPSFLETWRNHALHFPPKSRSIEWWLSPYWSYLTMIQLTRQSVMTRDPWKNQHDSDLMQTTYEMVFMRCKKYNLTILRKLRSLLLPIT